LADYASRQFSRGPRSTREAAAWLGLSRQFEGRERRRDPLFGDPFENPGDLTEGVHPRGRRKHCESTNTKEGDEQPPLNSSWL
jgi:hypothetical protein